MMIFGGEVDEQLIHELYVQGTLLDEEGFIDSPKTFGTLFSQDLDIGII